MVKSDVAEKDLYNAKSKNTEDKTPHITNLATTNTAFNANTNEVKGEKSINTNLDTTVVFNDIINEVKGKILNHITNHSKYSPEFNKSTAENFSAKLKQANLATKDGIADIVEKRQISMIN